MSLPVPNLDDLDFDALVEEARALIPRYAPEWTDHNVHDPGITLLELVAWLVDQEIYQAGFISDRHIKAFAALLGVQSEYAKPAHGLIWPHERAVDDDFARPGVDLKAGAKIACIEQREVPFELESALHITPARFADTPAFETGGRYEITAQTRNRRAALILDEPDGRPNTLELIFDRPLVERGANEPKQPVAIGIELDAENKNCLVSAEQLGRLIVDYRLEQPDGTPMPWRRIEIDTDGTDALNRTGTVLVRIPSEVHIPGPQKMRSRLRLNTRRRINPLPPRILRVALNVLPIVQFETKKTAVLNRSNGLPDQVFDLPLEGLTKTAQVRIEVAEEGELRKWEVTEDLSQAGPHDEVFELRLADDEIIFGNGVNGRIPPKGAQIRHLDYKLTQGDAGNLAAGLNWTVQGAPMRGGQSTYGSNRASLKGGADADDINRLRAAARKRAIERTVLLTNADLENAACQLQGMAVERANVLVGFHPALPRRKVPAARAVIIIPARAANTDPLKSISQQYIATIERTLNIHRVLGERLSVLAAKRVPVSVKAHLLIEDGFDEADVIEKAKARLNARLSDVKVQMDVEPWPVGRSVTHKEMKALLAGVTGIIAVPLCQLAHVSAEHSDRDLLLAPDEIAIGREHDISVQAMRERRE